MENIINVIGLDIRLKEYNLESYISLTDIARRKNLKYPKDVVKNWLRNRMTIEFLGLWEKINNIHFKGSNSTPFYLNQVLIILYFHLKNGFKILML